MGLSAHFRNLLTRLVLLIALFRRVNSSPIPARAIDAFASIDPSPDAWAETLSGIGPLILLIGERVTKQLLRNVRGAADAFSLAAAPLGLLSVVTSLIRCCGVQRLRAFIGYELEARAVAAIDMTRVNCGGVHAEMVDGYIVRSAAANPASQAVAVSLSQGGMRSVADEVLLQIRACEAFDKEKSTKGIPDNVVAVHWVIHILSAEKGETFSVMKTLIQAIDSGFFVNTGDDRIRAFCQTLMPDLKDTVQGNYKHRSPLQKVPTYTKVDEISPVVQGLAESTGITLSDEAFDGSSAREETEKHSEITAIVESTPGSLNDPLYGETDAEKPGSSSTSKRQPKGLEAQLPQLSFIYTLNAVSEFATTSPVPKLVAMLLGLTSVLAILAIYILALWANQWQFSVALLLVLVGYVGIVLAVMSAALIIHSSCACIKLESRSSSNPELWKDGLVVSVKNTDSMDTRGSVFMSSRSRAQLFEVVWMRDLTRKRKLFASGVAIALVLFFICHYLGLRSSSWWVAVAELVVCLIAAVARSATKDSQEKFGLVEQVRIDKRCTSTGLIQTQKCQIIEKQLRKLENMDARAYSMISPGHTPAYGESIAWHIAKLCLQDKAITSKVLELTGMTVHVMKNAQQQDMCAVLMSYTGGLLVTEGLAFPNARLYLAFQTKISDLALPTALLARAIMRQPEWFIEHAEIGKGIPLGDVYIFSITSIIDWWSISEDRNDFGDLQKNLQWCFVLINTAFFICLLRLREEVGLSLDSIEDAHGKLSTSNEAVAENVIQFLREGGGSC